jgi:broad specificity phosphatase PhoE
MLTPRECANLVSDTMSPPDSGKPVRLYFARHGESDANRLRIFSNRDLPHGLTPTGRTQMERLAERLSGIAFAAFYVSPTVRTRQSADILSARLALNYIVTPALAEFDVGILEGQSDAASWRYYQTLLDAWLIDGDTQARVQGGESFQDIRTRFMPLIENLASDPPDGAVLLLGHGGTFMCMLPLVLGNVSVEFARERSLGQGEVVIAEMNGNRMRCLEWGCIRFDEL